MRILFAALHPGYFQNFDSVIEELARRGHDVYLGFERPDLTGAGEALVGRLRTAWPALRFGPVPSREAESAFLIAKIRLGLDYLRYLDPIYPSTSFLPGRARWRAPTGFVRLTELPVLRSPQGRRAMGRVLNAMDRANPASPAIEQFLDECQPDLVVVTPLIGLAGTSQLDLLRSAQARRIRTVIPIYSWDHLSSKAIIRDVPDAVFVWNHAQQQEAVEMHGVPADRIVVTGAQCFDRWFGRSPSRGRAEFMRHAGLLDERPYVLWVCSTLLQGGPPEPDVAMRWLQHLRASPDPRIRDVAVLIRPHPHRASDWDGIDWRSLGRVTLFGDAPVTEASRLDYFDSLYHSAAVVGITTTAFLDAAVVGRPVMTIFFDEVRQEHEGSLHFQLLMKFAGGLMTAAHSLEEHEQQLAAMLEGPPPDVVARVRHFVGAFVHPCGWDVPATTVFADALERVGGSPAAIAAGPRRVSPAARLGLRALRAIEQRPGLRHLLLNEREAANAMQVDEMLRLRQKALDRKQAQRARKARMVARQARRAFWSRAVKRLLFR